MASRQRHSLETFSEWARVSARITSAGQVRPKHFTEYLAWRKRSGLASASSKLEAVALRRFFRFLQVRKILLTNPAEALSVPRVENYLPETLNVPAITGLLESVRAVETRKPHAPSLKMYQALGHRDRAILELLYASGLRVSELCDARLECLDLEEGMIRVTGKGNKTRIVPVGSHAVQAIRHYLEIERPKFVTKRSGGEIFLSGRGRGGKLTRARVWQLVKHHAARAGIEAKVYPHMFRHSCATHLLTGGCDLLVIKEILGHEDLSATQIYTHVDVSHLKAVHKQFHPRKSFKTESQMLEDFLRRFPVHREFHPGEYFEPSDLDARAA